MKYLLTTLAFLILVGCDIDEPTNYKGPYPGYTCNLGPELVTVVQLRRNLVTVAYSSGRVVHVEVGALRNCEKLTY